MLRSITEYDGLGVHVSHGQKESVLWIHGYTLDSTVWQELWAALPGWRHIGVDLPHHGHSRSLRSEEDLPQLGRTIATLVSYYDVQHVVGMSFGGMVAIQTAIESQRSFATLILGSAALGGGPTDPDAATKHLRLLHLYRQKQSVDALRDLWMQWPPDIFKGASRHPLLWNSLEDIITRHSWSEMQDSNMDMLANHSQLSKLASIKCPTLVLVGEDDMASSKRSAELIQRAIPNSHRVYMPATGHLSLLEYVPKVAAIVRAHLDQGAVHSGMAKQRPTSL
jgi:pimeloyl-ACP methyl ester carboxylesterase